MCEYSCSPCLGVTAHTLCSRASSHPLNYSYDGIIFFGGDAESGSIVVVRALVGEVSVVVTSADVCVDLVHGDV